MSSKTTIIAGSGRSGTTWVQDSLAEANGLRTVFEPLHPIGVPASRRFSYKYINADADIPELKEFMGKVLGGNYHSVWMNYRIRPDRFNCFRVGPSKAAFNVRKLVRHYWKYRSHQDSGLAVKFIRANLMLPWLARQYAYPIVLITRHPCAVIASRLKLGGEAWASRQALDRYRSDPSVVDLIKYQFGINISETFSVVEALTCVWCIENILPMQWAEEVGYVVSAYESLLTRPDQEWKRVIRALGLSHVPSKSLREAPSQQASAQMQSLTFTESHLDNWKQVLTTEQVNAVSSILELFSFSGYTVDNNLPA
jgi:hypothetical protein